MSDPVISVIIPAYNAQEHIRECLESVLAQSFRDFEIIVIDDGSDDDTGKIAARMALTDRRVVVDRIWNSGVSVARNRGMSLARG
ncbi:MAG: glycosyltransferase family 2 protein, partial [Muribaculaceae bacterium]|nr:glycosyltransferase family 2 protein [Muribaculaceae bacterium]